MTITPISVFSGNSKVSSTSFTSKRKSEGANGRVQDEQRNNSRDLAKVPVIVMLAMTPSLLNSTTPANAVPLDSENITEILASIPTEEINTAEVAQYGKTNAVSKYVDPAYVHKKFRFTAENKNWTMYFVKPTSSKDDKKVSSIYLIPDGYKKVVNGDGEEIGYPQEIRKLIYHDIGEENEFIGAFTREGKGNYWIEREMKLPDDIANELLDLVSYKTDLLPNKLLVNNFTTVKTAQLIPTKKVQ